MSELNASIARWIASTCKKCCGAPEVIESVERPKPVPRPDEVLVETGGMAVTMPVARQRLLLAVTADAVGA